MKIESKQTNWAHFIAGQTGVIPLSLEMPGVGKTELHKALAAKVGRRFHSLCLDQCLPEDLGGFPVVQQVSVAGQHEDGQAAPPRQVAVMARVHDERFVRCQHEPSVLLIDELTNCSHSTQAAALQLMAEGIPGTWIFAAANPVDQAAAGVELSPPMVNRLCLLKWEVDSEAVMAGFRAGFNFPAPEIPILPAHWQQYCPKWGALLAMFIERKSELLMAFPKDVAAASQPYPSPRSWTNLGRLLAAAESVGASPAVEFALAEGCVGLGAATEWSTWLKEQNLPDPEWLLEHPDRLALPRRGDLARAIVLSVLNRVRSVNTVERWESLCDVIEQGYGQNQEICIAALGSVHKCKPHDHMPRIRSGRWAEMNQTLLGYQPGSPVTTHGA